MGLEEFRLVDGLEQVREARAEGHGDQRVGERGDGDKDGDAGVADGSWLPMSLSRKAAAAKVGKLWRVAVSARPSSALCRRDFLAVAMVAMARLPDDMRMTLAALCEA